MRDGNRSDASTPRRIRLHRVGRRIEHVPHRSLRCARWLRVLKHVEHHESGHDRDARNPHRQRLLLADSDTAKRRDRFPSWFHQ